MKKMHAFSKNTVLYFCLSSKGIEVIKIISFTRVIKLGWEEEKDKARCPRKDIQDMKKILEN